MSIWITHPDSISQQFKRLSRQHPDNGRWVLSAGINGAIVPAAARLVWLAELLFGEAAVPLAPF